MWGNPLLLILLQEGRVRRPKFDNQEIGMRLALVGAVRDDILDKQELAVWLINYLEQEYPDALKTKYLTETENALPEETSQTQEEEMFPPGYVLLLKIARARRLLMKGGEPDADRAAAMLIDDCKNGRIGRISLDRPGDAGKISRKKRKKRPGQPAESPAKPQNVPVGQQAGNGMKTDI